MISMALEYPPQTLKTVTDRSQYQHCHITVPDMDGKLPAIALNDQYYYFFRTAPDQHRGTGLAAKLIAKGDAVVITPIPKGVALWVLEPNAQLVPRLSTDQSRPSEINPAPQSTTEVNSDDVPQSLASQPPLSDAAEPQTADLEDSLPFPLLLDASRFADCQIHVPDLDEVLAALSFEGNYYSFFRTVNNSDDLIGITRKLAQRGDEAIITYEASRYSIWVLEMDASIVS
jgi:hypothetical protein